MSNNGSETKEMSFWDHLDELRGTLFRIAIGIILCMIVVFLNKDFVFGKVIFAPASSEFFVYKWMCALGEKLSMNFCPETFNINFINTTVSGQFFTHISTSFWIGLVISFPWIIYQLWLFIRPALYDHERKAATGIFAFCSILFFVGAFVGYALAFPLALKFLGTYQVADIVPNMINLDSYINTMVTLCLAMGLLFQLPILIYALSTIGIVTRSMLRKYRKYAIVIILFLAAIITPTPDPFTMFVVSIPILLLYEFSIWICKEKKVTNDETGVTTR